MSDERERLDEHDAGAGIPAGEPRDEQIAGNIADRDAELGAAIDGLRTPPRPDGFISELVARIEAAEAAAGREPTATGESVASSAAAQAAHRRRFDGRRLRRLGFAAVAAAALITLGTLFGVSRQPDNTLHFDPDPATAREVIESTLTATGAAQSIQGVMIGGVDENGEFRELERFSFVVDADGDVARRLISQTLAQPPASPTPGAVYPLVEDGPIFVPPSRVTAYDSVYDAAARTVRTMTTYTEPQPYEIITTDENGVELRQSFEALTYVSELDKLAAGAPFREEVERVLPWQRLRAYLRQLLEGESPDMRDVNVDGRAAWELTTVQGVGGGLALGEPPSQPVTVVIDKETRLPLRYRWRGAAGRWQELRFSDYRLDDDVDPHALELQIPKDAQILDRSKEREIVGSRSFAEVDFDDVSMMREKIGPVPGLPAWRPQGFALAEATWSPVDMDRNEQYLPDGMAVATLSLAYRRGLDAFYVSAEPTDLGLVTMGEKQDDGNWRYWRIDTGNPFGQAWGPSLKYIRRHTVRVKLCGGAFDSCVANLVLDPSVLPHLYVHNDHYTATVSGDLSQDEMIQVAESMGAPWMEE